MACVLTFDYISVGGRVCDVADFVSGSGTYTAAGTDIAVTTADTKIHNSRQSTLPSASVECWQDKTSIASPAGCSEIIILKLGGAGGTTIATFNGIATSVFNESSDTSSVDVAGDPNS